MKRMRIQKELRRRTVKKARTIYKYITPDELDKFRKGIKDADDFQYYGMVMIGDGIRGYNKKNRRF